MSLYCKSSHSHRHKRYNFVPLFTGLGLCCMVAHDFLSIAYVYALRIIDKCFNFKHEKKTRKKEKKCWFGLQNSKSLESKTRPATFSLDSKINYMMRPGLHEWHLTITKPVCSCNFGIKKIAIALEVISMSKVTLRQDGLNSWCLRQILTKIWI